RLDHVVELLRVPLVEVDLVALARVGELNAHRGVPAVDVINEYFADLPCHSCLLASGLTSMLPISTRPATRSEIETGKNATKIRRRPAMDPRRRGLIADLSARRSTEAGA